MMKKEPNLGLEEEKEKEEPEIIPYNYLVKRSIWIAIQILIILVLLFFSSNIYNLIRSIYGF